MFCPFRGKEIPEGSRFCGFCGEKPETPAAPAAPAQPVYTAQPQPDPEPGPARQKPSPSIELCEDGRYRWVYEMNMYRNPTIPITISLVIALSVGITFLLVLMIGIFTNSFYGLDSFLGMVGAFVGILALLLVIGVIAYYVVAAMNGGRYIVLFEMDEEGFVHTQAPKQTTKAEALLWLGALVSGAPAGALLAASHTSTSTVFAQVSDVKVRRNRNVIYVNQKLSRNQIYAENADFDFVQDFVLSHVPSTAKVR